MSYNWLASQGVLNTHSEDIGVLAMAKEKQMRFALCCNNIIRNRSLWSCPGCSHALQWQSHGEQYANEIIEKYLQKGRRNGK